MSEIKALEAAVATAMQNKQNILDAQEKAKFEIYRLKREINAIDEASLPFLAAEAALAGTTESTAFYECLDKRDALEREKIFNECALRGLVPVLEKAKTDLKTAGKVLSDHEQWQRFEEIKTQLLEKYDRPLQMEARQVANDIDHHGPASHAYTALVDDLRKRFYPQTINY